MPDGICMVDDDCIDTMNAKMPRVRWQRALILGL
jgi:hypothetical protein